MKHLAIAFLSALALAALAPAPRAQVIQLKNGEVLIGKVEDPHEDGLTLRRFDNGGVLELRWDQLSSECAGRVKSALGLSIDAESEVMVPAELVKYELAGGGGDQLVGLVIAQDDTTITVRRQGVNYPIPRAQIRRRTAMEVPAMEVYTRDEFYNEKLNEIAPGNDADQHVQLADFLTRVRDYERAAQHLEKAASLGGGRQPNLIAGKLERLRLFKDAAAERELLDKIRTSLARNDFPKGTQLIAEFEKKYKKSKLQLEFASTKQSFQRARERYLINRVIELWNSSVHALANKKATEAGVSYESARDYAESQLGKDVRARVRKHLEIEPAEVDALWAKRFEIPGGPPMHRYDYGIASWTLGSDAILKDVKTVKSEQKAEPTEQEKQQQRQEERIRRAIERAKSARAAQAVGEGAAGGTPERWWESATPDERKVWIRAYYAEHGGDLKVEAAHLTECITCGGEGNLAQAGSSGTTQQVECPTCHGTRFKRWFRAR
jgi:hypothetical protein